MAHWLRGRNFENIEAVEVDLTEFFASKTRDWYRREIINLAERWLKTIESDCLYFEEYSSLFCQKTFQVKFCFKNITYVTLSVIVYKF